VDTEGKAVALKKKKRIELPVVWVLGPVLFSHSVSSLCSTDETLFKDSFLYISRMSTI